VVACVGAGRRPGRVGASAGVDARGFVEDLPASFRVF